METIRQYAREKLLESVRVKKFGRGTSTISCNLQKTPNPICAVQGKASGWNGLRWSMTTCEERWNGQLARVVSNGGCGWHPLCSGFWDLQAYYGEGRAVCERLLVLPGGKERTLARANALFAAVDMLWNLGELAGGNCSNSTWTSPLGLRASWERPGCEHSRGVSDNAGDDLIGGDLATARSMVEESLSIARSLGDPWEIAWHCFAKVGSEPPGKIMPAGGNNSKRAQGCSRW